MKSIAVIGAGTMGAGIAQLAAGHGSSVRLIDVDNDKLDRSMAGITKRVERMVEKGSIERGAGNALLAKIRTRGEMTDLGDVELVVEAVVENLEVKREVFARLEAATTASAVLATNTSSLSITDIAAKLNDPSRVVGMHFFNPAPVMDLVEIIAGEKSGRRSIDVAFDAAKSWDKTPVRAKDTPGFIVNRVARGFYLEGLRLLDEGVAGVDEIDGIMRAHGKFRMGPFELMDLVGIDVNFAVSTSVWERMGKPARLTPHEIQGRLVEQGHLGRKSKRGFYTYAHDAPMPAVVVDRRSFQLSPLLSDVMLAFSARAGAITAGSTEQYVFCRILGAVINEAGLAYSDGVASSDDIDTAMIKGTNYPRGPLAWSDEIGHRTVRGLLKALNGTVSDGRYESAPLFRDALD